jgi:hypothetical protein
MEKRIIGRKDKADFPELGLKGIAIKIDTGAFTSSIHCSSIKEEKIDGKWRIKFKLLDSSHPAYENKELVFTKYKQKRIKSSFGSSEKRFVIETTILLFGEIYPIELTLSERGEMKFPVLLGRMLLNKNFIVDTQKTSLSIRNKKQILNKKK